MIKKLWKDFKLWALLESDKENLATGEAHALKKEILERDYFCDNLLDVQATFADSTSDEKTVIGTRNIQNCIATAVTAKSDKGIHRFVAHTYPAHAGDELTQENINSLRKFLADIEKQNGKAPEILQAKLVSSMSLRDKNKLTEFEKSLIEPLKKIFQKYKDQGQNFEMTHSPASFVKILPDGEIIVATKEQTKGTVFAHERLHPDILGEGIK